MYLSCTGPLSTEPSTGVADEGGKLFVEGEAGDQGQHLIMNIYRLGSENGGQNHPCEFVSKLTLIELPTKEIKPAKKT